VGLKEVSTLEGIETRDGVGQATGCVLAWKRYPPWKGLKLIRRVAMPRMCRGPERGIHPGRDWNVDSPFSTLHSPFSILPERGIHSGRDHNPYL